jgi:hypothetical protein
LESWSERALHPLDLDQELLLLILFIEVKGRLKIKPSASRVTLLCAREIGCRPFGRARDHQSKKIYGFQYVALRSLIYFMSCLPAGNPFRSILGSDSSGEAAGTTALECRDHS